MKSVKISVLVLWVLCTAIFVIGVLTPLEFTHKAVLYVTFCIAFNGIIILGYLLTSYIKINIQKVVVGFIATGILIFAYEFYPWNGSGWQTKDILFIQKDNKNNIIAFQENDMGTGKAHRTVKIIQVTPLFRLVNELQNLNVGDNWIKHDEPIAN